MAIYQQALVLITFAGLLWTPGLAFAQDSTATTQNNAAAKDYRRLDLGKDGGRAVADRHETVTPC